MMNSWKKSKTTLKLIVIDSSSDRTIPKSTLKTKIFVFEGKFSLYIWIKLFLVFFEGKWCLYFWRKMFFAFLNESILWIFDGKCSLHFWKKMFLTFLKILEGKFWKEFLFWTIIAKEINYDKPLTIHVLIYCSKF